MLVAIIAAGVALLVTIREAEIDALERRRIAERETQRARAAEAETAEQLRLKNEKERQRRAAEDRAARASKEVASSKRALAMSNEELRQALVRARGANVVATKALGAREEGQARS